MPPRRDFRAKKKVTVVNCKGGKAGKKKRLSVPLCYAAPLQQQASLSTSSVTSSLDDVASIADEDFVDETWSDLQEDSTKRKRKFRRVRLKSKLKAYHDRKARLAASWLDVRQELVSALLCNQALPEGQQCVVPACGKDATGRCLQCGPGQFLCEEHIETVHAGGRSLHHPEIWKVCVLYHIGHKLQFLN